ncbi:uncharacterized protein HKW66_Vig0192320 [Vigna angularis]|uniref:Uncharacterized protein n=1 Tax=Phaseolus angularis TaxID=3914 RepID=A0A8T0KQL2_PHAAN|nr:uncharacterized protein HKW66_Vig0192320 [Vigna angularis]
MFDETVNGTSIGGEIGGFLVGPFEEPEQNVGEHVLLLPHCCRPRFAASADCSCESCANSAAFQALSLPVLLPPAVEMKAVESVQYIIMLYGRSNPICNEILESNGNDS